MAGERFQAVQGSVSNSFLIFIGDSRHTTDTLVGLTGLAYNTGSLQAYYALPGAAAVSIALVTQTVNGAYSSGGFVKIDDTNLPGVVRIDVPNLAFAPGNNHVKIVLQGAANMAQTTIHIDLVAPSISRCNTAQAGGTNTITLDASASALTNWYAGSTIVLVSGTGVGQASRILSYNGSTKVATVTPAWVTQPDATSVFTILASAAEVLAAAGLDNVVVEAGVNARQALSMISATELGQISGAGSNTITIQAANNPATTRVVATVDSLGDRSALVLTIPT